MSSIGDRAGTSTEATYGSVRHAFQLGAVILAGIAASLIAFFTVRHAEVERLENAFNSEAHNHGQDLAVGLKRYEEALYTIRDIFIASDDVNFGEFRTAAADLRQRHPGIRSLEWLPWTPAGKRTALERRGDKEVLHGFQIKDSAADSKSDPKAAPERPEYLPTLYIDPAQGNEAAFGFDQLGGPHHQLVLQARDTGAMVATPRVTLRGGAIGWSLFLPVYTGAAPQNTGERQARFAGCLMGSFSLEEFLVTNLETADRRNIEILLADHTPGTTEPLLISLSGDTFHSSAPPAESEFLTDLHHQDDLTIDGRQWRVLFRPTDAWLALQGTHYARAFLAGGLLLTGILAWVLHGFQQRAEVVRRLVDERTIELRAAQSALQEDIRQRTIAEKALRVGDDRYRAFIANSSEAIWRFEFDPPVNVKQPEQTIVDQIFRTARLAEGNDALARMYGFERIEQMIGLRLIDIMPPSDAKNVEHLTAYIRGGFRMVNTETHELDRQGSMRIFLNNMTGIVEDGFLHRTWGTQRDITDERARDAEKALMEKKLQETQKLESLGILAGGIAHDFNNLLTGILGNASLARMDLPSGSPAHVSLEGIETVAQRAAELCKQMLAYSGKGRFIVHRLDISELVRDTTELIQVSIAKNVVLKFDLSDTLPSVAADATQIRQIIMNLVINASDAIGVKRGQVTLSTGNLQADSAYLATAFLAPDLPGGEYVFLEVSDDGCGMDAATQARIFDPFFTTKFTGRGLGLAAVLGIVRGHGGALRVYSEPGRGSTFKLLLPATKGAAEKLQPVAPPALDWRMSGTVLIVDDEESVRSVTSRMLRAWGCETELAVNGREALEIFRREPSRFIAVLLDLTMPELDGTATFTELRRIHPEVRVLLMSGFNEQDAVSRFAGKGLAGFLQKPFKPDALQSKLRVMIENPLPASTE